jgi:hypothetical protein
MTVRVTEQPIGDISRESSGIMTATRVFLIYDDAGASLSMQDVISSSQLPDLGVPHPTISGIIAGSYTIRAHADRKDTYEVSYKYEYPTVVVIDDDDPDEPVDPNDDEPDYVEDGDDDNNDDNNDDPAFTPDNDTEVISGAVDGSGVVAFTMSVGLSIVDIWKAGPSMPASVNSPARDDIGGTIVSEGGFPISLAMPIVEIGIAQRFGGFFNAGIFLDKVGKRNAGEWAGFGDGSVLFTGVDVTQDTQGNNEATFRCSFDSYSHLRQVPERDEDGNPKVTLTAGVPSMNVYFKQPFPATVGFGFLPF